MAEVYRAVAPADDEGLLCAWADIAVINNSLMPNAIMEIEAWVKLANNQWQQTHVELQGDVKFPVNLAPYTTAGLSLQLATKCPFEMSGTSNQDRIDRAIESLAPAREIMIRVRGVQQTSFRQVVQHRSVCTQEHIVTSKTLQAKAA